MIIFPTGTHINFSPHPCNLIGANKLGCYRVSWPWMDSIAASWKRIYDPINFLIFRLQNGHNYFWLFAAELWLLLVIRSDTDTSCS